MSIVAVLGASSDPERYSYKALELLAQYGHTPIPIHPSESSILGYKVVAHLGSLIQQGPKVDTLTIYVNPKISTHLKLEILKLKPRRVIFNPGTENPDLEQELINAGIEVQESCTLVLLKTHQF